MKTVYKGRSFGREIGRYGIQELTMEEFRSWLMTFDEDKDGRISKHELSEAVRVIGGRFPTFKARRGLKMADTNRNGYIDYDEIPKLVQFADKVLQLKIVGC